ARALAESVHRSGVAVHRGDASFGAPCLRRHGRRPGSDHSTRGRHAAPAERRATARRPLAPAHSLHASGATARVRGSVAEDDVRARRTRRILFITSCCAFLSAIAIVGYAELRRSAVGAVLSGGGSEAHGEAYRLHQEQLREERNDAVRTELERQWQAKRSN